MLVSPKQFQKAASLLPPCVNLIEVPNNDCWIRDSAPTFIIGSDGVLSGIDWKFNAWGGAVDGLYSDWSADDKIAAAICNLEKVERFRTDDFVLEGGSIHTDGEGTLITTEACLLSKGRNPHLSKQEIENRLKSYLHIRKIIWLKNGIYQDETNEHVDNICAFVKAGHVVLAWTDDKNDPQYEMSKSCFEILSQERDARGRKLKITKLLLPSPQFRTPKESQGLQKLSGSVLRKSGERLAASYVNFYPLNGAVLLPFFDDKNDKKALETLSMLYPDREIIPIYSREILLGGGNIHCITNFVPLAPKAASKDDEN